MKRNIFESNFSPFFSSLHYHYLYSWADESHVCVGI